MNVHPDAPATAAQPGGGKPTLAPWTYRNPAFFDLEMDRIFKRHWLLAGHSSEMPEPGDYLTFDVAGERALLVRGDDGVVRAFHNVCRHRGLLPGRSPRAAVADVGSYAPFTAGPTGATARCAGCRPDTPFPGSTRRKTAWCRWKWRYGMVSCSSASGATALRWRI